MGFENAVKEGDEQRLFETYKLLLLIYKSDQHPKYAYETLHYLIKFCAILFEAGRPKWNSVVNLHGGKACNKGSLKYTSATTYLINSCL